MTEMENKSNLFIVAFVLLGVVAIVGLVIGLKPQTGQAYAIPIDDTRTTTATTTVKYLKNCEVISQQYQLSVTEGYSGSYFKQLTCPSAKIPIRTSFVSSAPGQVPIGFCDDYYIEQGAVYGRPTASIYFKNCHQPMSFEYELSATCCDAY